MLSPTPHISSVLLVLATRWVSTSGLIVPIGVYAPCLRLLSYPTKTLFHGDA